MYFIISIESDGTRRPMASTSAVNSAYSLLIRFSKIFSTVRVFSAMTGGTDVTEEVIAAHGSSSPGEDYILKSQAIRYIEANDELLSQLLAEEKTAALAQYGISLDTTEAF